MEVRNIDPKTDNDHNAGRVLGTVIRLVRPARHSPAPNPYRFLIDRALKSESSHHAGEVENRLSTSQRLEVDHVGFVGPPATYQPYFISKDDSGNELWWNPDTKVFETRKAINHQNAEMARTDSGDSTLSECQSAPSYPAPNSNHPNAEAAEATYPPSDSLFGKYGISSSSARPAPNSTEPTDLDHGFSRDNGIPPVSRGLSPRGRGVRHILSKLIDRIIEHSLSKLINPIVEHSKFSDPTMEMSNWGWRKKA